MSRSRRTKHSDAGRPRESQREEPRGSKEPRGSREPSDQPRLPSSQPKSTGDYFDYPRVSDDTRAAPTAPPDPFQYQVPDDAFQTPTYSRQATPDRPKEVVPDAPQIYTIDREPSFSPPRMSRRDSFEVEKMVEEAEKSRASSRDRLEKEEEELMRAYAAAKRRAKGGDSADIIDASYADEDPARGRRSTKDTVQEEANKLYRQSRKSAAEIRSRDSSANSVVEKWQEHDAEESRRQSVSTPDAEPRKQPIPDSEPEPRKQPNPYSEPNADVRIDTTFDHPEELTRFLEHRARSASVGQLLCGTRDPSASRERPLLNIVRPTPVPSPSAEKRREREKTRAAKSRSRSRSQTDPTGTGHVRGVSPVNVAIGPRGEIIDLADEKQSVRKGADIPGSAANRALEDFEKPDEPARKGWGVVNVDLAGLFGGSASDKAIAAEGPVEGGTRAVDAPGIEVVDEEPMTRAREFRSARSGEPA